MYAQIDSIISDWVEKHGLTLFTHTSGSDDCFRCVYVSSQHGECCQIWIDPPDESSVFLHAAEIESFDDEKMRKDWVTSIPELGLALDNTLIYVHQWFNRDLSDRSKFT